MEHVPQLWIVAGHGDGLRVFKAKSSQFLEYETKQLDKGVADTESIA